MLFWSIINNKKALMIVDPDADGFTSSALLLNYLYKLFPAYVSNNIQYLFHSGKQHGLSDMMDKIPEDVHLVICADSASNDYEQHEILNKSGKQVLVIDHHEADRISEYACVINNQLCDYPVKSLSGVGMVYKFCSFIDILLEQNEADNFLDLVALGIIADVMQLTDYETKHLITKGINNIINPFISTMVDMNSFSIGDELTPTGMAFYIAPYVNATIRVGTQQEKELLFDSMLDFKAYELIPSTKRGCSGQ